MTKSERSQLIRRVIATQKNIQKLFSRLPKFTVSSTDKKLYEVLLYYYDLDTNWFQNALKLQIRDLEKIRNASKVGQSLLLEKKVTRPGTKPVRRKATVKKSGVLPNKLKTKLKNKR